MSLVAYLEKSVNMRRFDILASVLTALALALLFSLFTLFSALKECGPSITSFMFLFGAPIVFVSAPWTLLLIAVVSFSIGLLWKRSQFYRTLVKISFVIALIAVPVVTFVVVPVSTGQCLSI